jgi:hypothetical protein
MFLAKILGQTTWWRKTRCMAVLRNVVYEKDNKGNEVLGGVMQNNTADMEMRKSMVLNSMGLGSNIGTVDIKIRGELVYPP